MNLCNGKASSIGDVANIIAYIQELKARLEGVSNVHVSCVCNKVAHAIAGWAFGSDVSGFWSDFTPSWLLHLATCDFVSVSPLES